MKTCRKCENAFTSPAGRSEGGDNTREPHKPDSFSHPTNYLLTEEQRGAQFDVDGGTFPRKHDIWGPGEEMRLCSNQDALSSGRLGLAREKETA